MLVKGLTHNCSNMAFARTRSKGCEGKGADFLEALGLRYCCHRGTYCATEVVAWLDDEGIPARGELGWAGQQAQNVSLSPWTALCTRASTAIQ